MSLVTFSRGIRSINILEAALGQSVEFKLCGTPVSKRCSGYVGWGRKKSGVRAATAACRTQLPAYYLEDGFLGYWGHPVGKHTRLSLNIDSQGIYYDARYPSDLETMLAESRTLTTQQSKRVNALIHDIRINRLSKYNHHSTVSLPENLRRTFAGVERVCLVVDQTAGDHSISHGLASESTFANMLNAAIGENPDSLIVIKTHPDVLAGKKLSAIGSSIVADNVLWIADDVHPHALIEAVDKVYVVTSQLGFEALLLNKPVVCFGVPFYAGWGLTDDRGKIPERRCNTLSLEELVHASLIDYPVYVDPDSHTRCEPEDIIDWIKLQRRSVDRKYPEVLACGFSLWKKSWLRAYTRDFAENLKFVTPDKLESECDSSPILVWGARKAETLKRQFPDRTLFTMEDGFVRSAGLGTDLKRPSSLIIDQKGIYYDSRSASELENLLNTGGISEQQRQLARDTVDRLILQGATKYNVGSSLEKNLSDWIVTQRNTDRSVILVPGQVEGDASIEFGSPMWKTNLELLAEVRKDYPEARIIYKPHPDIVAKNRESQSSFDKEAGYADKIVTDADIAELYRRVDRVCVLTSLSGFEALIRGIPVTVYGLPFYAGWGLTEDRIRLERREARLSLEDLVYTSLLVYPRYINWSNGSFCSLESVLDQLLHQSNESSVKPGRFGWFLSKAGNFLESWRFA